MGSNYTAYSEKKCIYANRDHAHVGAAALMHQRSEKKIPVTVTATARTGETLDKVNGKLRVKGKAVPLQAWSGPEGSRKLRFPDYTTMAQDGGKVVSLTHRLPLPPRNAPGTHFC
jgi:hypothetical protein